MLNDVDVVVRPDDMKRAFEVLTDDGWCPAGSGSVAYHGSRLASAVGINLVRGRFGNLDLHRTPFHPPYDSIGDDLPIWQRSRSGSLASCFVRVPCATDAIAISMAHGALDAHKSSDWLADIASGVDQGVDWGLLEEIVEHRRLNAAAAIALGYVAERLGRSVPAATLRKFEGQAIRRPSALLATLAETRPKAKRIGLHWVFACGRQAGTAVAQSRRQTRQAPCDSAIAASDQGKIARGNESSGARLGSAGSDQGSRMARICRYHHMRRPPAFLQAGRL